MAVDCAHDSFFPSLAIRIGAPDESIVPEIVTLMIDFHWWEPVTLFSSLSHAELLDCVRPPVAAHNLHRKSGLEEDAGIKHLSAVRAATTCARNTDTGSSCELGDQSNESESVETYSFKAHERQPGFRHHLANGGTCRT